MYKIKVNNAHSFDISVDDLEKLDAIETSSNQYHVLQESNSIEASVLNSNFNTKTYTIQVNNNDYTVQINDHLDQQIEALGFEIGSAKQVNNIKAPMPGLILEINVSEGQEVQEDDSMMILEAMKMETEVSAPSAGTVQAIHVGEGDAVVVGQALFSLA